MFKLIYANKQITYINSNYNFPKILPNFDKEVSENT